MNKDYNSLVIGFGGQGIVTTAQILARAGMFQGFKVLMAEIHGMAQRGGRVQCSVRFGDSIHSPTIPEGAADLVISLEFAEVLTALPYSSKDTIFVLNTQINLPPMITIGVGGYPEATEIIRAVKKVSSNILQVDAQRIAGKAGSSMTVNSVMLGAGVAAGHVPIEKQSIVEAMKVVLSQENIETNVRAYDMGYSEVATKR